MSIYATTAEAVANFFIDHKAYYVDNLKLQKIVYISFGWYSANFDNLLFSDRIEAWPHGPIIPSLYHQFKAKGADRITDPAIIANISGDEEEITLETPRLDPKKDENTLELLDLVYSVYHQATQWGLSSVTRKKGTSWSQTYGGKHSYNTIPTEMIRKYYQNLKKNLEENQSQAKVG